MSKKLSRNESMIMAYGQNFVVHKNIITVVENITVDKIPFSFGICLSFDDRVPGEHVCKEVSSFDKLDATDKQIIGKLLEIIKDSIK